MPQTDATAQETDARRAAADARSQRLTFLFSMAVLAFIWFGNLQYRLLSDPDEGRYAEIAREMAASGDWVTPRLNGILYFEKPPLQYWLTTAAFRAFEVDQWTARLPPALAGFLAVLAVAFTAGRLAGPVAGAYAGLALAGCVWHIGLAHFVTLDSLLAFLLTAALCAFLLANRERVAPGRIRLWMLVAWAAIALATLTKGVVALAIPGATLVLYTLFTRDASPWRKLRVLSGLALFAAIVTPWFVLVSTRNPGFAEFFFVHEHLQRFLTTGHKRTGAWWYFVPLFVVGVIPWLTIAPWTWREAWRAPAAANGFRWRTFCLVWAAFVFVFFGVVATVGSTWAGSTRTRSPTRMPRTSTSRATPIPTNEMTVTPHGVFAQVPKSTSHPAPVAVPNVTEKGATPSIKLTKATTAEAKGLPLATDSQWNGRRRSGRRCGRSGNSSQRRVGHRRS